MTLVTRDGQRIRGIKKNEDVFASRSWIQRERIQGYVKPDLKEVIYEKNSLMPAYPRERLSDGELDDLVGISPPPCDGTPEAMMH